MIATIIQLVINVLNWIFQRKKETADDIKLREDTELANAIKRGDSETVSAIREKRRRYPNATILLLCACFLFVGCDSLRPRKTIPLATGVAPYQLPVGNYIDTKGELHIETTNRWSLSEQDLFNKSSPEALKIDSNVEKWRNRGLNTIIYTIFGIFILGIIYAIIQIIKTLISYVKIPLKKNPEE